MNLYSGFDGRTGSTGADGVRRRPRVAEAWGWCSRRHRHVGRFLHRRQWFGALLRRALLVLVPGRPEGRAARGTGGFREFRRRARVAERPAARSWNPALIELGTARGSRRLGAADRAVFLSLLPGAGPRRTAAPGSGALARRHPVEKRADPVLELGDAGAFDGNGSGQPAVWNSEGYYWMLTGRNQAENRRSA